MKTESKLPIKEIILMIFSLIIAVLVVVCIMRLDNNTKLLLDECNEIKEQPTTHQDTHQDTTKIKY